MSLYTEWRNLSDNHESQEAEVKFWEAYLQAEASIYNELLNNKQEVIEGKVSELAAKYNVSVEYFMGFIDGISESLKEDITLETIEADSAIKLDIDLDIFSKDMDYIPYDLKVSKIKDLIKKAKVITIASSPFFIEQDYAIKVLKELFNYDIIE